MRIGITYDFHPTFGYFLKADLVQRLHDLKIDFIPLTYDRSEFKKLRHLDGLLIPGGVNDLNPKLYGKEICHKRTQICHERAAFEFKLLDRFLPTQKPCLFICWGLQMLNVYCGGSLYQHLPEQRKSKVLHEQKQANWKPTHRFQFEVESRGPKIFGRKSLKVNSTHHQGVKSLGRGLILEGRAEDGLVEAVSLKGHPFAWGVQWHPERLKGDVIIPAFLKACRRSR